MRQVPIKKFLKNNAVSQRIYVLFDGNVLQYVGLAKKQSVQERLLNHVMNYFSRRRSSKLTRLIYDSKYFRGDWGISVFRLDEVSKLIGRKIHCLKCAERAMYDHLKFEKGATLGGNFRAPYVCKAQRTKRGG